LIFLGVVVPLVAALAVVAVTMPARRGSIFPVEPGTEQTFRGDQLVAAIASPVTASSCSSDARTTADGAPSPATDFGSHRGATAASRSLAPLTSRRSELASSIVPRSGPIV
jgi:hypothetical protein